MVLAGVLHDTIEDSIKEKRVSYDIINERFGKEVADLVGSVTEKEKEDSWQKRKKESFRRNKRFFQGFIIFKICRCSF